MSYFQDHGIEDPYKASSSSSSNLNPDIETFFSRRDEFQQVLGIFQQIQQRQSQQGNGWKSRLETTIEEIEFSLCVTTV